ncbi:hypothetical protein SARC_05403 [Sphaeroforma arctica JP610]|uniref:Uncharacterized protein n=1 Tax=Sphaeroforma arctica JP610 TaxID=667725 RepID=A0A0L0G0E4_9EUKA|nr:hypothetical protein SARC_05403 [Sphaeroforma arctica JP610]KNC82311.1 hypothetical protein SARC_05403 [Sphaeroforma arctica JP610]|eukprot:XP_014156213.1 hypothetical protein SARC_05403 [Sphaeroforma arctica JP610]
MTEGQYKRKEAVDKEASEKEQYALQIQTLILQADIATELQESIGFSLVRGSKRHALREQPQVNYHSERCHKKTNPNTEIAALQKENKELKVQLNTQVAATQKVIHSLADAKLKLEKINQKLQDAQREKEQTSMLETQRQMNESFELSLQKDEIEKLQHKNHDFA